MDTMSLSKSKSNHDIEELLRFSLANINNWLRFAEAKNAALVVANIGASFGALRLAATQNLYPTAYYYALIAGGTLLLATGIALASFIPQLKIPWLAQLRAARSRDNVLFYGHIANYTPENYLKELYARRGHKLEEINALERDYAEQMIINSRIALRKYGWFNIAVCLTIIALATLVFALILLLIHDTKLGGKL